MSTVSNEEKPRYERIGERAARGAYELIEPLDYLLLAELQEEGALMGGYFPLATSVNSLKKTFKEVAKHDPNLIQSRLRVMHLQGLVIKVRTAGSRQYGWQRTKNGKELVEAWQQRQK